MTTDAHNASTTARRIECPACGKKAKRVSTVTLGALLKDEFAGSFAADGQTCCDTDGNGCHPVTSDTGWRFCDSPGCDVVYFSEEGDSRFTKSQLKVVVGVKEMTGERPLCYCFGHSVASIRNELRTKGRSDSLADIRAKMKDPGCRCETENPSGACCLGNVTKGIQIAQEELGMTVAQAKPVPTTSGVHPNSTSTRPPSSRGETVARIGTVVSAVMASACCWLPLVLLAVGVSGAGIAASLEAYRPVFIVVTFGFLAAAFYFTYCPKQAPAVADRGCCAADSEAAVDCYATTGGRRFSMMTLNKAMLWVVTVLAVAFLFFPSYIGVLLGSANGTAVTEKLNWAVFQIDGMTCEGCAATVAQAIRQVPRVVAVEVSYEKRQAVVGTEACCAVPRDKILAALKQVGYRGTFVETNPPTASSAAISNSETAP